MLRAISEARGAGFTSRRAGGWVSEEIKPEQVIGETAGALAEALADKSGALEPARQVFTYIAESIHYSLYPRLVERALGAAAKIEASGLPRRAIPAVRGRLLRALLQGAAEEDEPDLQELWENLLANALTDGGREVPVELQADTTVRSSWISD